MLMYDPFKLLVKFIMKYVFINIFIKQIKRWENNFVLFIFIETYLSKSFTIEYNLSSLVLHSSWYSFLAIYESHRNVESKPTWCITYVYAFYAFSSVTCHKQLYWFYFFGIRMQRNVAWNGRHILSAFKPILCDFYCKLHTKRFVLLVFCFVHERNVLTLIWSMFLLIFL